MGGYEESYLGRLRKLIGKEKVITTAARAIIRDEQNRVLLIQRSDNHLWGFPAGSQELDESILECLTREVKEETGLSVLCAEPMAIYSNQSIITTYGDPYHLFQIQFLVTKWDGILVRETDESIDARFFALEEIPQEVPASYREVIADLKSYDGKIIIK